MTSTELEREILERLRTAELLPLLEESDSQFLEFPDGFFVELVLNDGSRLVDVERVGRELREELRKQGIDLDILVRALWRVEAIGDPFPARGALGGIKGALAVPVILASGKATTQVEVDVGLFAIEEIRRRIKGKSLGENDAVREVVKEFIEMQLSLGGESYWKPDPRRPEELSEGALLYLFGHTSVAQNLGLQG